MKPTNQKRLFIPRLYCNVFGHEYQVSRNVTYHVKEYTCKHCKHEATTNSNGYLTELTPKFREINRVLERIHTKRTMRLRHESFSNSDLKITA